VAGNLERDVWDGTVDAHAGGAGGAVQVAPLLRWRQGGLERSESNGLLFRVIPEPDFPVCELAIRTGSGYCFMPMG
jgi:hypothetical protein